MATSTIEQKITPEPVVRLANYFQEPYNLAVATARTCYSSRVVETSDVARDAAARAQRDRIAESTYKAGHHTTIQHPTFQFVLEKVSRQPGEAVHRLHSYETVAIIEPFQGLVLTLNCPGPLTV